ncbi:MAG: hypothetical protein ACXABY_36540 [Candidatus Thorarchaeota archaeon]|jgi:hypothetical protein
MDKVFLGLLVAGAIVSIVTIIVIVAYLWLTKDSDVGEDEFRQAFINSEDNSK